jgi:hypothetical protein
MTFLLKLCWRAYDASLRFYPPALRAGYGFEMSELFRQQTTDALAEGGWPLLLAVIWCAVKELFTEALPARMGSPALIAGAMSLVCTSTTFLCLLWALENPLAVKALGDRVHDKVWHSSTPTVARNHRPAHR